jgi:hypothetical protein
MRQPNGKGVRHATLHEEAEADAEAKGGVAWELGSKSRSDLIWSSGQVHGERSVFRLGISVKLDRSLITRRMSGECVVLEWITGRN